MPSNSYDLVVLGDDLAALVCGTLCARRGMRTLVLGTDRPARYTLGPHKLPVEPASWPTMPGSGADRVLKELHAELGLRRKLREPKIPAQLIGPDFRIDLGSERLGTELERELGKESSALWLARWEKSGEISRLLNPLLASDHAFPGVGFFEKRELSRLADRAGTDAAAWWTESSQAANALPWRHLAAIALRHPAAPPVAIARAVDAWRAGPVSLRGDGDAIRELFVEKLQTAGGELRAGRASAIDVSWGKVSSVTLVSGDEIGAGQVVSSLPPNTLAELLGKKAPKRLGELADSMKLVGYRYTLNVVIDEAGVPEHMAPIVAVVAAPDKEPVGDAAFSIHLGDTDDTGRVILSLAAVLPVDGPVEEDRIAPKCMALRAGLWKRLGEVMPFFERHLVLAHSPFEANPPQVPGGRGSYDVPRNLPLPMMPIWSGASGHALENTAETGLLPYGTGLKNLTLTGEQILPTLGVEGALVAGWSAARIASELAGKKKDYLSNESVGAGG